MNSDKYQALDKAFEQPVLKRELFPNPDRVWPKQSFQHLFTLQIDSKFACQRCSRFELLRERDSLAA